MADLQAGLQCFVNGAPYELLYHVGRADQPNLWAVRPLYVEDQSERFLEIPDSSVVKVHVQTGYSSRARELLRHSRP